MPELQRGELLAGKRITVSGGAGNIGRTLVKAIAMAGASVVVADIDGDAAGQVAAEVSKATGQRVLPFRSDITSEESVLGGIGFSETKLGGVDAVVLAAYPRNKEFGRLLPDVTYRSFCENMDSHLGGFFLMMQKYCEHFKARGGGNVVTFGSMYAFANPRFHIYDGTDMTVPVEYAAAKTAILHLTRYFARYYHDCGIRLNCVSPGGILRDQPESFLDAYRKYALSKGMLDPEDIAGPVVWLLSEMSAMVNGQNIVVDDGWTL